MDYFEQRIQHFAFTNFSSSAHKREIFRCKLRKQHLKAKNTQFRKQLFNYTNQYSQKFNPDSENLQKSIEKFPSMSKSDQFHSLKLIKSVVSTPNAPVKFLLKCGLIEKIFPLTASNLDIESKSCILNIFSNILTVLNANQIDSLENLGVIDYLFINLTDSRQEIVENSLWGIANYIATNENSCMSSINKGILDSILKIINVSTAAETLQIATWALLNIAHYESLLSSKSLLKFFEICEKLLDSPLFTIKSETLIAISAVIRRDNNKIEVFIHNNIVKKAFFYFEQEICQANLLKIALYVVSGTNDQTQFMLDFGLLDLILPLFKLKDEDLQYDLYFLLSNVAGGTAEQAELLMNHTVFKYVIKGIDHENMKIRTESSFVVRNLVLVIKNRKYKKDLVNVIMGKISNVVMCFDSDLIMNYLHVFEWFIIVFGKEEFISKGYDDVLQCILRYKNVEIFGVCDKILNMYF